MSHALARTLSILGHPLLTLPATALLLIATRPGGRGLLPVAIGFAVFAGLVMAGAWWQVHRGRWQHVDASGHEERHALNRGLFWLLTLGAIIAWGWSPMTDLALGLALSALLIGLAQATARWCKLSLHVAFAVYAACLLSAFGLWAAASGAAFALAIGWSRLTLSRHQPRDLVMGTAAGLAAGLICLRLIPSLTPAST